MREEGASSTRYYHFDHQGTTQCLTDSSGAVTDRFASDAWGVEVKRTGSSINRQWYIGNWGYYRQREQMLDYVRRRHLSFLNGRWISMDPIQADHNLLIYVSNQPVRRIDPTGLVSCQVVSNSFTSKWVEKAAIVSGPTLNASGAYDVTMVQTRRHYAQVLCKNCSCKEAPAEGYKYAFYQYRTGTDSIYDGKKWAVTSYPWWYDASVPGSFASTQTPKVTKTVNPGGKTCDWLFEYAACDGPGMATVAATINTWLCQYTYGPFRAPGTLSAGIPALFITTHGAMLTKRDFCTTFGKDEKDAMSRGGIAWGVDYGFGHPSYPPSKPGSSYWWPNLKGQGCPNVGNFPATNPFAK
jgi:RHS repeat-associated protein